MSEKMCDYRLISKLLPLVDLDHLNRSHPFSCFILVDNNISLFFLPLDSLFPLDEPRPEFSGDVPHLALRPVEQIRQWYVAREPFSRPEIRNEFRDK